MGIGEQFEFEKTGRIDPEPRLNAGMDRDEVADLILTSPETGKGLSVVSGISDEEGATVFIVGNLSERWKVSIRIEELA